MFLSVLLKLKKDFVNILYKMSLTRTDLANLALTKIEGCDSRRIYTRLFQGLDKHDLTHALHCAVCCGNEVMVKFILDFGGYDRKFRSPTGELMIECAKTQEIRDLLVVYRFSKL